MRPFALTPIGGGFVGLATVIMTGLKGRIAGVSGTFSGIFSDTPGERLWRALFVLGIVFGLGMTNTERVQGFLDLAGAWDPTLAFVMAGGMIATFNWQGIRQRITRLVPSQVTTNRLLVNNNRT